MEARPALDSGVTKVLVDQGNDDEQSRPARVDPCHSCSVARLFYRTSPSGREVKVKVLEEAEVPETLLSDVISTISRIETIAQERCDGEAVHVSTRFHGRS